ncbi:MAG: hypothetical protein C6W56_15410 [Caldibacillus debilis]|nr:MAG: hypothetical protein C6W56_15410 [Caldibacillus debilis]
MSPAGGCRGRSSEGDRNPQIFCRRPAPEERPAAGLLLFSDTNRPTIGEKKIDGKGWEKNRRQRANNGECRFA